MKYIDSEKLIAEIERLQEKNNESENVYDFGTEHALKDVIAIITSLQQEQPKVDLEKEIDNYLMPIEAWQIQEAPFSSMENIARHFFELGLKRKEGAK